MVDVKNSSSQLYKYRKINALRTQRKYYQVSLINVSPIQGVDHCLCSSLLIVPSSMDLHKVVKSVHLLNDGLHHHPVNSGAFSELKRIHNGTFLL